MIIVTGTMEVAPGNEDQAKANFALAAEKCKSERGCIEYRFWQSVDQPTLFRVYEEWEDKDCLREHSALPVIFLTSKDDEQDEEAGFAMGADDYISKPFSLRLLLARVRAILRRSDIDLPSEPGANAEAPRPSEVLERGRLVMDPARHKVTWDGRAVSLTVTEFLLLEALAVRPGVIKSRNQLMDAAYPDDVFVDDRTVDSHIKRMRRKFRSIDPQFSAIDTLYGAGYSFAES